MLLFGGGGGEGGVSVQTSIFLVTLSPTVLCLQNEDMGFVQNVSNMKHRMTYYSALTKLLVTDPEGAGERGLLTFPVHPLTHLNFTLPACACGALFCRALECEPLSRSIPLFDVCDVFVAQRK